MSLGEYILETIEVVERDVITEMITETLEQNIIELDYIGTTYTTINGGNLLTKIASASLGGNRAVIAVGATHANYADKDTLSQIHNIIGVTQGAAASGANVQITALGEMIEPSWTWTPDQYVYLGNNGLLTQTVPTTGFLLVIGTAIAPTVLSIHIGAPVQLN